MNIFSNLFFIFLFLYAMLHFRVPDIENNDLIVHKLVMFIAVFCFQFILLVISKIRTKCKVDVKEITGISLETAILSVVGYSIYNDIIFMQMDRQIDDLITGTGDRRMKHLHICIIIIILLAFANTLKLMFGSNIHECQ